jgi:hypothetical protein
MNATESNLPASVLTKKQVKVTPWKEFNHGEETCRIRVAIRYDDSCGNGHNTFAITAETQRIQASYRGRFWVDDSFGMLHDLIAAHFPELAPALKWHLCSSDGPMHYIANTTHLASNRDCWGGAKGEQKRDKAGKLMWQFPIVSGWDSLVCQNEKPADRVLVAEPVVHEGKERELDAARNAAIWPEATDGELCASARELTGKLQERLPALMQQFKAAVESLGLVY